MQPITSEILCSATPIKSYAPETAIVGTERPGLAQVEADSASRLKEEPFPSPSALASAVPISSRLPPVGSEVGRLATAARSAEDFAFATSTLRIWLSMQEPANAVSISPSAPQETAYPPTLPQPTLMLMVIGSLKMP